jgi:cullin-4
MLVALGLYEVRFEPRFLRESAEFYRAESRRVLDQSPVPEYLVFVERRLREEGVRVTRYLDPATRAPLVRCCERELVSEHVAFLLEKGFDALMEGKRAADLGRLYALLARVDALREMKGALGAYAKRRGLQIVQGTEAEEEKEMVPLLLQLKQDLDDLLRQAMRGNEDFERALRDAIEVFINSRENRPAELIAKFIDLQLRNGPKGAGGEEQTEQVLERVVVLFRFLSAKDVFEAFYKKDLAKRLLVGASSSADLERSMIAKLKTECGSNFTNKLEGMFKDVEQSKDVSALFNKSSDYVTRLPPNVEVAVSVLTTGFWPAYPSAGAVKLHESMAQCQKVFEAFYQSRHEGRRLTWQPALGMCILRAAFTAGNHELTVSFFQALVLLLFNTNSGAAALPYREIRELTGLDEADLKRTLTSLACGKVRPLAKEPAEPVVGPDDAFSVNADFKDKRYRITISSLQVKETAKENKETHEKVAQERQYQIDAAIVRIMKSRKTLAHNLLIAELLKQLRFNAKPADLKKRIENLIEREYLERDEAAKDTYSYLA